MGGSEGIPVSHFLPSDHPRLPHRTVLPTDFLWSRERGDLLHVSISIGPINLDRACASLASCCATDQALLLDPFVYFWLIALNFSISGKVWSSRCRCSSTRRALIRAFLSPASLLQSRESVNSSNPRRLCKSESMVGPPIRLDEMYPKEVRRRSFSNR